MWAAGCKCRPDNVGHALARWRSKIDCRLWKKPATDGMCRSRPTVSLHLKHACKTYIGHNETLKSPHNGISSSIQGLVPRAGPEIQNQWDKNVFL